MAKISDLSGDEREKRIAELKRKMQESAKQAQANAAAKAEAAPAEVASTVASVAKSAAAKTESVAAAVGTQVVATAEAAVDSVADTVDRVERAVADVPAAEAAAKSDAAAAVVVAPARAVVTNGAAPVDGIIDPAVFEKSPAEKAKAEMTRRELLTYAWGGALGLVALGTGALSFFFMYPRFKAGQFGGKFFSSQFSGSALPATDAVPVGIPNGKFWWVNTEEDGPKAIYMVCTHLGCLYKWVGERNRFECPCHGSKFTREGLYIEGPAPRSLDSFTIEEVDGEYVVDTGSKVLGGPAIDSPAKGTG